MKRGLLYYPMYVNDFDEDPTVLPMNLSEVGLYLLALNESWKRGGIPADPEDLARLIRRKPSEVLKAWPKVAPCWVAADAPGMLVNPRQEKERKIAADKSAKAKKSACERYANADALADANAPPNEGASALLRASDSSSSSGSSVETTTTNKTPTRARGIPDEEFQIFLRGFMELGVAVSETDARKCAGMWVSLEIAERLAAFADAQRKSTGEWASCAEKYVPRPWNYLGDKQWERVAVANGRQSSMSAKDLEREAGNKRFREMHPEIK